MLTLAEKCLVGALALAILTGLAVRQYRQSHRPDAPAPAAAAR